MKAIAITLIISIAAMFCSYCFTHQFNVADEISESGAMVLRGPSGEL